MAVVAVDACAHHSNVTNERATRIEKHYNAQLHKTQQGVRLFLWWVFMWPKYVSILVLLAPSASCRKTGCSLCLEGSQGCSVVIFFLLTVGVDYSSKELCVPRTVTCSVGSGETHTALASLMLALHNQSQESEEPMLSTADHNCVNKHASHLKERSSPQDVAAVLAGLHACGDLSATMLRCLPVVLPPPLLSLTLYLHFYWLRDGFADSSHLLFLFVNSEFRV